MPLRGTVCVCVREYVCVSMCVCLHIVLFKVSIRLQIIAIHKVVEPAQVVFK